MLTSILAAAVILALLIIVHETGHFLMAKRVGVRVIRFAIGYPPIVWGVRRGETEYAIGATPFGGYVRMLGEEVGEEPRCEELENYIRELALDVVGVARENQVTLPAEPDAAIVALARMLRDTNEVRLLKAVGQSGVEENAAPGDSPSAGPAFRIIGRGLKPDEAVVIKAVAEGGSVKEVVTALAANPPAALMESFQARAFPTQSLARRFAIVLAGPLFNILFAPILMTIVFLWGVPTLEPVVGKVSEKMPAYAAGLRPGDRIVAVNGQATDTWAAFSSAVKRGNGSVVHVEIDRQDGGAVTHLSTFISPKLQEEPTIYGTKAATWIIGVMPRGDQRIERYGPVGAVGHALESTVTMTGTLVFGIWEIVRGATPMRQALGGPIMIAQMAGQEAHQGLAAVLMFTVMLSLELGIINLLPVPLLDGGHLFFFACEGIRGEPLKLRHREIALQLGLFLLVALMAFVIFNDISRIVQG